MFLSAVWTLILTAPIHCRGSIGEQVIVMLNLSKSVLMNKQTPLHIRFSANLHFCMHYSFKIFVSDLSIHVKVI